MIIIIMMLAKRRRTMPTQRCALFTRLAAGARRQGERGRMHASRLSTLRKTRACGCVHTRDQQMTKVEGEQRRQYLSDDETSLFPSGSH